jgi:histone acetyltransferase SAS3
MTAAALLEEELQNSLATSEEDAEFEEDDELAAELMGDNADAYAANIQLQNGMAEATAEVEEDEEDGMEDEEAMISDEDAEGEEDDEMADPASNNGEAEEEEEEEASEDDDEDEDGEGVGAVKIQPGLLEDDEDAALGSEDEESAASIEDDESKDSTDAEVEEQWEQAAEEEEDDEPANPNRCMYVSPTPFVGTTNICPDSANKMKRMTLARILNFTLLAVSVEIMVSLRVHVCTRG